jgi:hypothetical protein
VANGDPPGLGYALQGQWQGSANSAHVSQALPNLPVSG